MKKGDYNLLTVDSISAEVYLLKDENGDEVSMPQSLCEIEKRVGEQFNAFVFDSNGKTLATDIDPLVRLDHFAMLKLSSKESFYAEMDMGIPGYPLRVPLREQVQGMNEGDKYLVFYFYDKDKETYVGSCKVEEFLIDHIKSEYSPGQKVKIQAFKFTELGIKVIVDDMYEGLVYDSEVFQDINFGEIKEAFIKKLRSDKKIDITLQPFGYRKVEGNTQKILDLLKAQEGILHLGDKSDPESIAHILSMSKKTFKKSIGALYKQGLITIEAKSIHLIK